MYKSLRRGSFIMGLIGSITSLVVGFVCYGNVSAQGDVIYAIIVLLGGIIGGILGIVGTAYIKLDKLFTPMMQLVSFLLVLASGVTMVIYCSGLSPTDTANNVLPALPFLFIPDILVGVSSLLSYLSYKYKE
ncbi:MAG: hypothetical protein SO176_04645 [Bacilli bacterium]|nr:hypothetical protein [Bacilli bacterium]